MSKTQFLTLRQLLDAMEQNGYKKIRNMYVQYGRNNRVSGACALGTASLNLGIEYTLLGYLPDDVFDFITQLNDETNSTIPEIARQAREKFSDRLDEDTLIELGNYNIP